MKASRAKKFLMYQGKISELCQTCLHIAGMRERIWWGGIFKALSEKNMQPRIDGEIRTFQNRQTLTNFINTKLALQEILRGVL